MKVQVVTDRHCCLCDCYTWRLCATVEGKVHVLAHYTQHSCFHVDPFRRHSVHAGAPRGMQFGQHRAHLGFIGRTCPESVVLLPLFPLQIYKVLAHTQKISPQLDAHIRQQLLGVPLPIKA